MNSAGLSKYPQNQNKIIFSNILLPYDTQAPIPINKNEAQPKDRLVY